MKKVIIPALAAIIAAVAYAAAMPDQVLQIFSNGQIIHTLPVNEIDYMEVHEVIAAPGGVNGDTDGSSITITWNEIENATYNVYRSSDKVNYTLIAEDLTECRYVDTDPLAGSNYYRIKAVVGRDESEYSETVAVVIGSLAQPSGIYMGVMAFNRDIYSQPMQQLTAETRSQFDTFVDSLNTANGTLLYYTVDNALSSLQATELPADLINVALVTFTDGLDKGSVKKSGKYENNEQYLAALNKRIVDETVVGQHISAYSVGVRGNDVTDVATFKANLQQLASPPENAFEVTNMSEVNSKFIEIAKKLNETSYVQTISLTIPGEPNGTRIRFTFDNVSDAANSQLYIEGVFNLRECTLTDVTCHGLTSTSGDTIKGVEVDDIFVTFTFDGVQTESKKLISKEFTDEWTYVTSTDSWQINSEFDKTQDSEMVTKKQSAAVMLVLDASSSLGSDFVALQRAAKEFIATLCPEGGNTDDPDNPFDPSGLYSTTPTDMTVAVTWGNTRYYLTPSQYKEANLSDAVVEGVTVIAGTNKFIVAPRYICGSVVYNTAKELYYPLMPDENQALIMSTRWDDINSVLESCGFSTLSNLWVITNSAYTYISGSGGKLHYSDYSERNNVRYVSDCSSEAPIIWSPQHDLDLIVKNNSGYKYISQGEWTSGVRPVSGDEILGLAVRTPKHSAIIKLKNECGGVVYSSATKIYGASNFPGRLDMLMFSAKYDQINAALKLFGGDPITSMWGYIENGEYYYVFCRYGVYNQGDYSTKCPVRLRIPWPEGLE